MFDQALPLFAPHCWLLFLIEFWFFLALSKASNFVKLCIFFVSCRRCSPNKDCDYFCGMEGALFCKAMWIFFGVESGFLANYAIVFVMAKSLSHTNFIDSFCCIECIMEICWFHYHFPSPLLLLHFFFISTIFFSLLSLPLIICFLLLVALHCHQSVVNWFVFNVVLDIHMVGAYSHDCFFFFHVVDGDGVFKSLIYISK